ncbi:MAG: FliA/WhiG family RNA polymerase sigma factor [Cellulosilyticaceae bacterium]
MYSKSDLLWEKYNLKKDAQIKSEIIDHYVYLIKLVAGRLGMYLNHYVDIDDLVGYGVIGLIDAIDKFDSTKNVKFETYASLRIRGAILDEIRKLDWVPRSLRKKQKDLYKMMAVLENKLGRSPTETEMAEYLEISLEEYYQLQRDSNVAALVFIEDYQIQAESVLDDMSKTPDFKLQQKEITKILIDEINKLPEREKIVVTLYYFEELTLKEISATLSVSESRISQLHTKGVSRLRQKFEQYNIMMPL